MFFFIHRNCSCIFSDEFPDKDQIAQRKQNHINLNLSRPYLRRDDAHSFERESQELKLVNPHNGLKSLGLISIFFASLDIFIQIDFLF